MMKPELHNGDCLDILPTLPDQSVDAIITDPPYGTTACKWDSIIPLEPMWEQLKRIIKPKGAIVLMASQPFTTTLISSNIGMFKYDWVWRKSRCTGFLQSKFMPMKQHESALVFCVDGKANYYPQKTTGHTPTNPAKGYGHSPTFGASKERNYAGGDTSRYPVTVQDFKSERGLHPTQKPVALMEYLIKTYTQEGETVLDFTMGSGTTGVACQNTGRSFVGIERDEKYFEISKERIQQAVREPQLEMAAG